MDLVFLKKEMIDISCVMVDEAVMLNTYHLKYYVTTYLRGLPKIHKKPVLTNLTNLLG